MIEKVQGPGGANDHWLVGCQSSALTANTCPAPGRLPSSPVQQTSKTLIWVTRKCLAICHSYWGFRCIFPTLQSSRFAIQVVDITSPESSAFQVPIVIGVRVLGFLGQRHWCGKTAFHSSPSRNSSTTGGLWTPSVFLGAADLDEHPTSIGWSVQVPDLSNTTNDPHVMPSMPLDRGSRMEYPR